MEWDKVWETVHNRLATETTKSIIWEQLHLNMHTTYSYNKWHNRDNTCPLCLQNIEDKFHILLECPLTTSLWKQLSPLLQLIHPDPVTEQEMVFGMLGKTPAITLRNWLTYELRACIYKQENIAYHNGRGKGNALDIKRTYNSTIRQETLQNLLILQNQGRTDLFEKYYMVKEAVVFTDAKGNRLIVTAFPVVQDMVKPLSTHCIHMTPQAYTKTQICYTQSINMESEDVITPWLRYGHPSQFYHQWVSQKWRHPDSPSHRQNRYHPQSPLPIQNDTMANHHPHTMNPL